MSIFRRTDTSTEVPHLCLIISTLIGVSPSAAQHRYWERLTVRLFFNRPDAAADTDRHRARHAGSFHILGHGGCAGDEGHCEVPTERRPYDRRTPHQLTPLSKRVVVTDALRRALTDRATEILLTAVAVLRSELVESWGTALMR